MWARGWDKPARVRRRPGRAPRHPGPRGTGEARRTAVYGRRGLHPRPADAGHAGNDRAGRVRTDETHRDRHQCFQGKIVDQVALGDALRSGQIAGAGVDVFAVEPLPLDDPLLDVDNVVLTPHVAGATYETSRRRGAAAAENVQRVAKGDKPLYVVT